MDALALGLALGMAAGLSPGPLLVLVITSTLRHGWRAGTAAACAPLVTDLLVIAVTLVALGHLPQRGLAVLGALGALIVVALGLRTLAESRRAELSAAPARPGTTTASLRIATVVNLVSPHPWIAWATVLGPLTVATWRDRPSHAVLLVLGFYVMLIGAKVLIAVLVAGGRRRLTERGYRAALAVAGGLLMLAGAALGAQFLPSLW